MGFILLRFKVTETDLRKKKLWMESSMLKQPAFEKEKEFKVDEIVDVKAASI